MLVPASASAKDYAATALNIIPSGQFGSVPVPAGADEQAKMYDALTPLFDQVTDGDLVKVFKSERFGATDSCPCRNETVPHPGIEIVRDRFNVPHITGRNRLDLDWAAGWVLAEDRGLLLAQARYPARMAALDAPGINAFSLVTGLKAVTVTRQADAIINRKQTAALKARGAEGRAVLADIDEYVLGFNAYLKQSKSTQTPWTRVDVYSLNALAGQIFGQGGGDETRRSELLDALQTRLGAAQGKTVWNDLTEHLDQDAPVTIDTSFPYEQVPANPTGNAIIDNGSMNSAGTRAIANASRSHQNMSNFLLVDGKHSNTGHPLFVAGPQIGYYYPGLTLEMDLKAPGIEARGAAMPGGAGNLLIGRGPDFAWTLTSAGSDTNDQFVETLCGGSDVKYLYKGKCRTMGHIVAGTVAGVGRIDYRTTIHGPVLGYATSGGKRVAISFDRSSHGKDILWQLMFKRMTDGKVTGLKSFYAAAATSPFTFNVGYADDRNIATYSAGALPIRDPRVDPRLPTIGTGQYEWKGLLKPMAHPHQANPASGTLVNWNNKPAKDFGSSDSEWTYGSIQRVQMLRAGLAKQQTQSLATVVSAMNAAATQDIRVDGTVMDGINAVLSGSAAPSARSQQMLDLLNAWRAQGSSRLDRDLDGKIDAGAAATIMDTLYPKIADAVLAPVLGPQLAQLSDLEGVTNSTKGGFTGGRINYVDKDLRSLAGTTFSSPFSTRFCGAGDLSACRASLWQAFQDAGAELAAAQGGEDPAAWTSDADAERITFAPGLLQTTIRYTNRPSGIQQVLSFSGHRPNRK
ncbi:MAG: peptidase penicillin amidase [Solirubrobacterales bacterium]|nr:peptidase penicillin amidase [Solirubrobacterales bacterium]